MAATEVSGRAFLGLTRFVKDAGGADLLRELVSACPDTTQRVFQSPIRALDWHPYDAYVGLLGALEEKMGASRPMFARRLGEIAGQRDLGTILRVYVALASAERLIRACRKIWPSYYRNAGVMEAITWKSDDTRLRIFEFPAMAPAHCRLMEGWMASTMQTIGFQVQGGVRETLCMSRGAPFHEFVCTWTKR